MNFSIITIAREYPSDELSTTLSSLFRQTNKDIQLVLVISSVTNNAIDHLTDLLHSNGIGSYRIIANEDNSLYDAMNIGLDNSQFLYSMFLNAGDSLASATTISDIKRLSVIDTVNAFPVLNKTKDGFLYRRPSNIWLNATNSINPLRKIFYIIFYRSSLPPHQGLLAPYSHPKAPKLRFDLGQPISADSSMTRALLALFPVTYHLFPDVAVFELGGLSTKPSLKRVSAYFHRGLFIKVIVEFVLIIFCFIFGLNKYYSLMNQLKGFSFVGQDL